MKKIIPESLYDFRFVSAPSFSPDGSLFSFMLKRADREKNGYTGDIWLGDRSGKQRRLNGFTQMTIFHAEHSLIKLSILSYTKRT